MWSTRGEKLEATFKQQAFEKEANQVRGWLNWEEGEEGEGGGERGEEREREGGGMLYMQVKRGSEGEGGKGRRERVGYV